MSGGVSLSRLGHPGFQIILEKTLKNVQKQAEQSESLNVLFISKLLREMKGQKS